MAKRARSTPRGRISSGLVVEDEQAAKPPMGIENALVLVTFVALLVAFVLSQIELSSSYGQGLF